MKLTTLIIFSVIALLATSCATMSSRDAADRAVEEAVETPATWAINTVENKDVPTQWLESFNDPILLKLIEEGLANNRDLQVAAGNMDKAWLLAKQSGSALKPTADLSLSGAQSGSADGGASNSSVAVGLQVSWEVDVWGRIRAGVRAAEASAQAAQADYIFALHSLSANIAKTYFKVIEAKLQADIARKNLEILKKTMRITQAKYDNGRASGQDVALNRANLAAAQEQLVTIEGSQRDAIRALEVLLGRYPNATTEIPNELPDLLPSPPAGIPSEILERRPDIVSAERQIAAAFDATDQAQAARLPRFSLTSSVNGASNSLSDILDPTNLVWQLGANLMAPLLDGGRRKIDVEIATIEQEQAIANYVQKALVAFSEVENNLDQGRILADRKTALSEVRSQSAKAYYIAELRYREGESDLLDTLQIQQQVISAESSLLSIKRSQLEQRINLYLSLGGSWQINGE
jgi:NodT family efflux transporter outer membrane factor (OMF) lipoprotein